MAATEEAPERISCATYTHARRHPMVLGQIGGWTSPVPLTPAQIVVLLVTVGIVAQTWRLWGDVLPPALSVIVAVGLPCGATWAVRKGRVEGRSLVRTVAGYMSLVTRLGKGQVGGRPYHPSRPPQLARWRVFVVSGDELS